MTRAELKTQILRHCQQQGANYHESDAEMNAAINRALAEISGLTLCFVSDDISFAPTAGTRTYNYDKPSAVFTLGAVQIGLVEIVSVAEAVGGGLNLINDFTGRPGPVTLGELQRRYPNYQDTSAHPNAAPVCWFFTPPAHLNIWPAPPTSPGTWKVHAYYQHPPLSADSDEVQLPDRFERDAVLFMAHQWIYAYATGEARSVAAEYLGLAREAFARFGTEIRSRMASDAVRGYGASSTYYLNQN